MADAPHVPVAAVAAKRWLTLDAGSRAAAEAIVATAVRAQRRRQLLWWAALLVQAAFGFWLVNDIDADGFVFSAWVLGGSFLFNLAVHLALGVLNRARLALSAQRESFDVSALVDAVELARRQRLTVNIAVRTIDARRPIRAA